MKAKDFSAWLSAIGGLSAAQRAEAVAALAKAGGADPNAGPDASSMKTGGKRGRREDALGTTSLERVESQGCPHCASAGAGRMGYCAFAARAAVARSTR